MLVKCLQGERCRSPYLRNQNLEHVGEVQFMNLNLSPKWNVANKGVLGQQANGTPHASKPIWHSHLLPNHASIEHENENRFCSEDDEDDTSIRVENRGTGFAAKQSVGMSRWGWIGEMEAVSGITHLLASTFVHVHTFQLIRTPLIPSRFVFAISDMFSDVFFSFSFSFLQLFCLVFF